MDGPEPLPVTVKHLPPPPGDSPRNTHNTNMQKASPNTAPVKQKLSSMFCGLCAGKMCMLTFIYCGFNIFK